MSYTKEQIAAALDYAVLKPTATLGDVTFACMLANNHNFASVCVRPCDVKWAAGLTPIVSTVVGFPHGVNATRSKVFEAQAAVADGAKELDMVMNYGRFLEGALVNVYADIALVRENIPDDIILKVILETCYLNSLKIHQACLIASDAGANFVKTSTGFGPRGATSQDIIMMKLALAGTDVKIKASGGIGSYNDVAKYLDLGCTRIGSSKWMELLPNE
jgi:deoxyribose-phosphate aldolase